MRTSVKEGEEKALFTSWMRIYNKAKFSFFHNLKSMGHAEAWKIKNEWYTNNVKRYGVKWLTKDWKILQSDYFRVLL